MILIYGSIPSILLYPRAKVRRADNGIGLLLELEPKSDVTVYGYAHISRIADDFIEKFGKQFKRGTAP